MAAAVPWPLGLCTVGPPLCDLGPAAPPSSFLRPSFSWLPGTAFRVPGWGSALFPLFLLLFSHTLHNKGFLFYSFFFSFLFGSQKTEETIFINNLIKNSKEVVWWGEHGRKSGLSLQGDFAMCKGSCTLVNGFSGSRPGRDGKKTKASVRRPRASGKEGLVYACWNRSGQVFV